MFILGLIIGLLLGAALTLVVLGAIFKAPPFF
jgi:hypothetical protein